MILVLLFLCAYSSIYGETCPTPQAQSESWPPSSVDCQKAESDRHAQAWKGWSSSVRDADVELGRLNKDFEALRSQWEQSTTVIEQRAAQLESLSAHQKNLDMVRNRHEAWMNGKGVSEKNKQLSLKSVADAEAQVASAQEAVAGYPNAELDALISKMTTLNTNIKAVIDKVKRATPSTMPTVAQVHCLKLLAPSAIVYEKYLPMVSYLYTRTGILSASWQPVMKEFNDLMATPMNLLLTDPVALIGTAEGQRFNSMMLNVERDLVKNWKEIYVINFTPSADGAIPAGELDKYIQYGSYNEAYLYGALRSTGTPALLTALATSSDPKAKAALEKYIADNDITDLLFRQLSWNGTHGGMSPQYMRQKHSAGESMYGSARDVIDLLAQQSPTFRAKMKEPRYSIHLLPKSERGQYKGTRFSAYDWIQANSGANAAQSEFFKRTNDHGYRKNDMTLTIGPYLSAPLVERKNDCDAMDATSPEEETVAK